MERRAGVCRANGPGSRPCRVPWALAALCGRGGLFGEEAAPLRAEKVAVNG